MNTPNPAASAWATEIRRLRDERDLTRTQLADHVGVSYQAVQQWESGRTVPANAKQAALIELGADLARVMEAMKAGAA